MKQKEIFVQILFVILVFCTFMSSKLISFSRDENKDERQRQFVVAAAFFKGTELSIQML